MENEPKKMTAHLGQILRLEPFPLHTVSEFLTYVTGTLCSVAIAADIMITIRAGFGLAAAAHISEIVILAIALFCVWWTVNRRVTHVSESVGTVDRLIRKIETGRGAGNVSLLRLAIASIFERAAISDTELRTETAACWKIKAGSTMFSLNPFFRGAGQRSADDDCTLSVSDWAVQNLLPLISEGTALRSWRIIFLLSNADDFAARAARTAAMEFVSILLQLADRVDHEDPYMALSNVSISVVSDYDIPAALLSAHTFVDTEDHPFVTFLLNRAGDPETLMEGPLVQLTDGNIKAAFERSMEEFYAAGTKMGFEEFLEELWNEKWGEFDSSLVPRSIDRMQCRMTHRHRHFGQFHGCWKPPMYTSVPWGFSDAHGFSVEAEDSFSYDDLASRLPMPSQLSAALYLLDTKSKYN